MLSILTDEVLATPPEDRDFALRLPTGPGVAGDTGILGIATKT
jgi:hypothetical protein